MKEKEVELVSPTKSIINFINSVENVQKDIENSLVVPATLFGPSTEPIKVKPPVRKIKLPEIKIDPFEIRFIDRKKLLEKKFKRLSKKHLKDPKWRLFFKDTSNRLLGQCRYGLRREIIISNQHIKFGEWDDIYDTLIHELAHAIVYERGVRDKTSHGLIWQRVAVDELDMKLEHVKRWTQRRKYRKWKRVYGTN